MPVKLHIANGSAWAAAAADAVAEVLQARPSARVAFPTGHTPLPLYAELRRRHQEQRLDTSRMRAMMLDEYLDAPSEAFTSWSWLRREIFDPLEVTPGRALRLAPGDYAGFERALEQSGGCDLMLLGLGANGHLAFNEPGSAVDSRTRTVELTPVTASANAAYWGGAFTPHRAVTIGLATILAARQILLLVRGSGKASALRRMMLGPMDTQCPAGLLRQAAHVRVLADEDAAAALPAGPEAW